MPGSDRSRRFPKFCKTRGPLSVEFEQIPAADAEERISKVMSLILRAAARAEEEAESLSNEGEGERNGQNTTQL